MAKTAALLEDNVLLLVCALPLLVPFGLTRNIDLQAAVVTLTGILAWTAVVLRQAYRWSGVTSALLALYLLCCGLSLLGHPTLANAFGGPLMRLGTAEVIAAVGCGLALRAVSARRLSMALYVSIATLALISLPYSLLQAHGLVRVGGILHQPDFLAVTVAVGLLLGVKLSAETPRWRSYFLVLQLYLLATLLLTQTRAVIGLALLIGLWWLWRMSIKSWQKLLLSASLIIGLAIGLSLLALAMPTRLTNTAYASNSLSYRLDLQHFGLEAAWHEPLLGYGLGSLRIPLACPTLHNAALQQTCRQGYYFDSSHNVFLDMVLALGWLGGLSFLGLTSGRLYRGLRGRNSVFSYAALLIALYYFTNPSDLEITMLFWVLLLRPQKQLTRSQQSITLMLKLFER